MTFWKRLSGIYSSRVIGLKPAARFMVKAVILSVGWLVRVEGADRLSGLRSPVVFAFNHNNYAETIIVPCFIMFLTGRKISFFVHWMFKDIPFAGWLMRFIDPIWVWSKQTRRGRGRRRREPVKTSAVDQAVARFRSGVSLGIFPEGTRNKDPYVLKPPRKGLGEIVMRTGAAVVPVGIEFSGAARRGKIPFLGRMVIRIGARLGLADGGETEKTGAAKDEGRSGRRRDFSLGREITDRVMCELSRLSGKEYRSGGPRTALAQTDPSG